jgi:ABC-type transport system involved in Fe-S cluster assembly fused permease/ATPase subunit
MRKRAQVLSLSAFHILPSLLDVAVCLVMFVARGQLRLAAVTFVTVAMYLGVTMVVTEWRVKFRQEMIASDNGACYAVCMPCACACVCVCLCTCVCECAAHICG